MKITSTIALLTIFILAITSCSGEENGLQFREQGIEVPEFSVDRAYQYIEEQVELGPRVPGTEAHVEAKNYFVEHFQNTAGQRSMFVQEFEQEVYGDTLTFYNVIASFGLQHQDRIVLAAHWDSRPRSEEDSENPEAPVLGADDGGSGVGVLMEFANIFAEHDLPVGVDIILFDGEDYGEVNDLDHYFIGSRYWSQNPPVPGYSPRFGVLLDMVGGEGAVFPKEGNSMNYAPNLVNEIWSIAREFGHENLFLDERGGMISDDHVMVQRYAGIPMIDIIHHSVNPSGGVDFPPYWHTQNDTMEIIDKDVLQAVGDVMLELIYNRIPK